jgi:hypothetical protein
VTFGGEPGRDDSGLPPVNVEIPDDARELDRDVIAYRRELRVRRRRALLRRIFGPFMNPGTAVPLIAICAALSMIAGALLSVLTISPASAPTRPVRPAVTATARPHTSPSSVSVTPRASHGATSSKP